MQSIPVQSWSFEHESVIRIGRSTDNHVILYSAVVSRYHVEVRKAEAGWEIVNLGANGTYLDGKRITQVPVVDGVIIRLARSGPNVQIHLGAHNADVSRLVGENTVGQSAKQLSDIQTAQTNIPEGVAAATRSKLNAQIEQPEAEVGDCVLAASGIAPARTAVDVEESARVSPSNSLAQSECCRQYIDSGHLFCLNCGKPLKPLATVGTYQIIKILEQDELSTTELGWKNGQTVLLKTLRSPWTEQPEAVQLFDQEARQFLQINHPALPKYSEVLVWLGQPYLVTEPTYGRSLRQIVAGAGALSQAQAIARMLEVCDALDYLHRQTPSIVHGRLQPDCLIQCAASNLIITGLTPGRVIAPLPAAAEYAAPEQKQGHASPTSDLYAIGPTLAYLLTGKAPSAFYATREQGLRFYAEYVPNLTSDLIAIIRKLTNPQPDERFTSASELAEALQTVTQLDDRRV